MLLDLSWFFRIYITRGQTEHGEVSSVLKSSVYSLRYFSCQTTRRHKTITFLVLVQPSNILFITLGSRYRLVRRIWDTGLGPIDGYLAQQPIVGQVLPIIKASRSHSVRHVTLGRTPLDEWSARHRDLYLVTHNTHRRQTSMHLAGFEPAIPPCELPKTHVLDRAVAGIQAHQTVRP